MTIFVPRPWQVPMLDHVLAHDRCALWAGMGLGKTPVVLTLLESLYGVGGETQPTLILGPLRVARKVWSDEVRKWDHLAGLSVVPIIGSEKERLAALRYDAPVYATNYDNLVWLIEHWGDRWPYRTVIADESDYIKGHRISFRTSSTGKEFLAGQGAKRAGALARISHTHVRRFIELTGTPAPNGLTDLWAQLWFLDRGRRLGRTFDSFKQRWFTKNYDGYGSVALAHAEAEIHNAVKDICLTIDGKDWFDLAKPIINNVYVELPIKARKLYREMEKEMFVQIEQHSAEAFNAAARTQKCLQICLAAGTEVLTDSGWRPIESVARTDLVWDGEEWVVHSGAVYNGHRDVVVCDGVSMTPDHRLLTVGGWATAEEIRKHEQDSRYDRPSVRLPDHLAPRGLGPSWADMDSYLGGAVRLWGDGSGSGKLPSSDEPRTEEVLRVPAGGDADRRVGDARDDRPPSLELMERDAPTLWKSTGQGLDQLWRAGNNCVRKVARILRELLGRHGADVRQGPFDRQAGQRARIYPRELPLGDTASAGQQHPSEPDYRHTEGRHDGEASGCGLRAHVRDSARSHLPVRVLGGKGADAPRTAPVYDIREAGPRNRFVIRSPTGQLLISHNCNGAVYVDPLADDDSSPRAKQWAHVHDAKLEALESIVHETGGVPLMVCYEFKSDLARLLKAFPKGRALKTQQDEDDFKAGKIPMLFLHPKSGGHGIDGFQYACNNIVFFGHNWSLGQYQQVIERIGPVRQMQAGFERPVWVHHIIARDTVDELVMERRETKRDVQDLLLAACKRR